MAISIAGMYGKELYDAIEAYASDRADRSKYDAVIQAATMQANACIMAQDNDSLYPEFDRRQLEEELLKEQAALILGAQEKLGTTDFNKIVHQITNWERRSKPIRDNSRQQKIKRNQMPKIIQ